MMTRQRFTCPCGYTWEQSLVGTPPADLRTICPMCSSAAQATLEQPSHTQLPDETAPSSHPGTFSCGETLAGFSIIEALSRGGMGVIYKARQAGLNRLVALKVISPERLRDPEFRRRFEREVQAVALLNHPNIVTVYHTDLAGPVPYLVMEYVAGIDLHTLTQRVGPLPVVNACWYIQQACEGLQHAFEQGLVHRDIKPGNLMVTPNPMEVGSSASLRRFRVKILDLGLARINGIADDEGSTLTQAGQLLGTPDYMAPEQIDDPRRADIRSDLYSLGATLFFLVTGTIPFPGASLMRKLAQRLGGPPSLRERWPDAPAELEDLLKRLLAVDPARRHQTPAELADALEMMLAGLRSTAVPRSRAGAPVRHAESERRTPADFQPPASTHNSVHKVLAHVGGVQTLSLSADGRLILTGGRDETLRMWDVEKLRQVCGIEGNVGPVQQVCLAPSAKWAASCSLRLMPRDMVVQLWELATGRELRRLRGHRDQVHAVAVTADGRRIASGSADRTVRIWSLDQKGSPSIILTGHTGPVRALAFVPRDASLLSAADDGQVFLWGFKTATSRGHFDAGVGPIVSLALGGASLRIAVAGQKLRVRQANGNLVDCLGHQGPVLCTALSADGDLLLSGGSDNTVRLWRAETGEELCRFEEHTDKVQAVAFSPDGQTAYSGSADGTLRRWPLPT